uniref:Uncharacterized protein n=1 Tax=Lactuca sativa TaxID=4236 RepID=A0A9R1XGX4_LACSA|nr:hypothetical protein LSAT_V11C500263890 [Lactuca sativa]
MQYALSKIHNVARMLLTLEEKDPRRIYKGEALMRRINNRRLTLLTDVLGIANFLPSEAHLTSPETAMNAQTEVPAVELSITSSKLPTTSS